MGTTQLSPSGRLDIPSSIAVGERRVGGISLSFLIAAELSRGTWLGGAMADEVETLSRRSGDSERCEGPEREGKVDDEARRGGRGGARD